MTTDTSGGAPARPPSLAGCLCSSVLTVWGLRQRYNAPLAEGSARCGAIPSRSIDAGCCCAAHARLPRLRLPVPLHGRRRRALVSQPRRAPRRRGTRGHLPDAAPVGARRAARASTGVRFVAVGPRMALYTARTTGYPASAPVRRWGSLASGPPGRRYDVVHTRLVPLLLAARRRRCARPLGRYCAGRRLARGLEPRRTGASTWAPPAGFGIAVQRLCARVRQRAFCFSRLHAERLRREGLRGEVTVLEGEYDGPLEPAPEHRPSRS